MKTKKEIELLQQNLLSWYDENKRDLPFRKTKNPYHIWVSEIMLQQTRVEAVKNYFIRFIEALPTIESLANVEDDKLLKLWQGLGYYNRARMLKKAAQMIVKDYAGIMPNEKTELMKLPGIGEYTAGAIASIAFSKKVTAVDGNVLRVFSRLEGIPDDILEKNTKERIEKVVESVLPNDRMDDFNQAIMEVGATVCLPNGAPRCEACPFYEFCYAREHNLTQSIPYKTPKKARKIENRTILMIKNNDKFLLNKRPSSGLLANLFEFVNLEGHLEFREVENYVKSLGFNIKTAKKLTKAKHIFTHIEWQMEGYLLEVEETTTNGFIFASLEEIDHKYSIPNAYSAFKKQIFK